MQHVLRKRILRDLAEYKWRWLALGVLLVLSLYLIVSIVGAAEIVLDGTDVHGARSRVEDGQFTVFVPLTDSQIQTVESRGVELEPMFSLDMPSGGDTLRAFALRQRIDLAEVVRGRLPESDRETALERRYCEVNGIAPGDTVTLGSQPYTVTGVVTSPDYDGPFETMADTSIDSERFGTAFVTQEGYRLLLESGEAKRSEEYLYAYLLHGAMTDRELRELLRTWEFDPDEVADPWFRDYWDETVGSRDDLIDGARELADRLEEMQQGPNRAVLRMMLPAETYDDVSDMVDNASDLRKAVDEMADEIDKANLTSFVAKDKNPRIAAAANDVIINKEAGLLAGVIILILLTYVISVFVVHAIEEESAVIGTLYALGVKRRELLRHYLTLPVIVTLLGGLIGTVLGYSPLGVPVQTADNYAYFSLPDFETVYKPYLLIYGVVVPPLVAAGVNWLVIRRKLNAPALRLIRRERRQRAVRHIRLGKLDFVSRFRIRQLLRELRSVAAVWFGLLVTLTLMFIGVNAYVMCDHIRQDNPRDTKYEYMYLLKYPEKTAPEGGTEAYAVTLKREVLGYDLDVTVLGLTPDNPYFDVETRRSMSHVTITSAMAQKYGLAPGDQVILSDEDEERDYAFTVDAVTAYSPAFYVFMDIDSMRELFDAPKDYYNVVFSDRALDIPAGRLYSVTDRAAVAKAGDVFVALMMPMVWSMVGCTSLILAVVLYLMMKVTVDRSSYGIALFKIFGYRRGEIRRLYLSGTFWLIAVGAAVGIPLAKKIMDSLYPYLVSNVNCGMDLRYSWPLYAAIYIGVLLIYVITERLLVGRVDRISPNEVLKNRE